ncbi:hypothetical protein [Kribbella sp. NPDC049584]|uniref:hypothetical protein n=1 Tax=Kribbella sp. NPDC049584 TaxID=3154833 RepID=UPI0034202B47
MPDLWTSHTEIVQYPKAEGDVMQPGQALYPGDTLTSPNGKYVLSYQGDGNLVLWGPGNAVIWSSQTGGQLPGVCTFDTSADPLSPLNTGRLVIYGPGMAEQWVRPEQYPRITPDRLVVQDDGNVLLLGTPQSGH